MSSLEVNTPWIQSTLGLLWKMLAEVSPMLMPGNDLSKLTPKYHVFSVYLGLGPLH